MQEGSSRTMFAYVGCQDQTMRVVSFTTGKLLEQKSLAALPARPHLAALQYVPGSNSGADEAILSGCRSRDSKMVLWCWVCVGVANYARIRTCDFVAFF
eukprot:2162993-Ditylum_brightwellii.AAC.1